MILCLNTCINILTLILSLLFVILGWSNEMIIHGELNAYRRFHITSIEIQNYEKVNVSFGGMPYKKQNYIFSIGLFV